MINNRTSLIKANGEKTQRFIVLQALIESPRTIVDLISIYGVLSPPARISELEKIGIKINRRLIENDWHKDIVLYSLVSIPNSVKRILDRY